MRVGSLVFALVLFAVVGWMLWESGDFPEEARRMPFVIAVPTVGLLGLQLLREGWASSRRTPAGRLAGSVPR